MTVHAIEHTRSRGVGLMACLSLVGMLAGIVPAWGVPGTLWTTLPSLPTPRYALAAATAPCPRAQVGSCVYAVGGFAPGAVGTVEAYNPRTQAWSTLPPLPTPRGALAAAAAPCPPGQAGTCVYAVGGSTNVGLTGIGTVEAYNPKTNAWSTLPPLPTPRGALAAAAAPCPPGQAGACVYAVGGIDAANKIVGTVEAYNPKTNAWSALPSLPTRRAGAAAAAAPCPPGQAGACVYAVGGVDTPGHAVGTVEAYNPKTNAWSTLPPLPTPRAAPGAAAAPCPPGQAGTCVYTVGGVDTTANKTVSTVEAYNPRTDAWSALPPAPTPRYFLATEVGPCPPGQAGACIYAVGGHDNIATVGAVEAFDPPTSQAGD